MRSIFLSVSIFLRRYFVFGWLWYGLGDVIVELAHKSAAGKADRGCSKKQTKRKRQQKEFLSSSHWDKRESLCVLCFLCVKASVIVLSFKGKGAQMETSTYGKENTLTAVS